MSKTVRSADGTTIAYEATGGGPPLILVDGALCYRDSNGQRKLAAQLADRFEVYVYDRRGRGESGDTAPYAVERELEDVAALIEVAGGSASLYGISSGAALALEAARRGLPVERVAMYEAPFMVDDSRPPATPGIVGLLRDRVEAGRRGDAVKLFMREVGVPRPMIAAMPLLRPVWRKLTGVAHTLPYDFTILDGYQTGEPLPADRWSGVTQPALVAAGGKSPAWMRNGMSALAAVLPNAEHRIVPGQTHVVKANALAPVLAEFFSRSGVPAAL